MAQDLCHRGIVRDDRSILRCSTKWPLVEHGTVPLVRQNWYALRAEGSLAAAADPITEPKGNDCIVRLLSRKGAHLGFREDGRARGVCRGSRLL